MLALDGKLPLQALERVEESLILQREGDGVTLERDEVRALNGKRLLQALERVEESLIVQRDGHGVTLERDEVLALDGKLLLQALERGEEFAGPSAHRRVKIPGMLLC